MCTLYIFLTALKDFLETWVKCSSYQGNRQNLYTAARVTLPVKVEVLNVIYCARGPGFDTQSGHILSFLLPLIQKGQLSATGEGRCTRYWLTA